SDMPARCAAAGSFQLKSSTMYVTTVWVTVRVLPSFLTVTLIRFDTLSMSILGVRSYSDQRYASMQASVSHCWGGSIAGAVAFAPLSNGSEAGADASFVPSSDVGFAAGSVNTGTAARAWATENPSGARTEAVGFESPASSRSGVAVITAAGSGGVGACA